MKRFYFAVISTTLKTFNINILLLYFHYNIYSLLFRRPNYKKESSNVRLRQKFGFFLPYKNGEQGCARELNYVNNNHTPFRQPVYMLNNSSVTFTFINCNGISVRSYIILPKLLLLFFVQAILRRHSS